MPQVVGTLLIQNTQILPQGGTLSSSATSSIFVPTSIDGGGVTVGVLAASIDKDTTFSFDGGLVT